MTISVYQVDNVIKAYNKQNRPKLPIEYRNDGDVHGFYRDSVTVSQLPPDETSIYEKISYDIRDLILKGVSSSILPDKE